MIPAVCVRVYVCARMIPCVHVHESQERSLHEWACTNVSDADKVLFFRFREQICVWLSHFSLSNRNLLDHKSEA